MTSQHCLGGRGPVVADLSQSNCVENCHMWKEHLITICQKLWPWMKHLFIGTRMSIKCHNRYNTHFETGMIVLLYRISCPQCLCPDMEHAQNEEVQVVLNHMHVLHCTSPIHNTMFK